MVLLTLYGSYQDILETPSFDKCPLRVYSSRLIIFILIVMVNSASESFLTCMHARTHAHPENPYIEVGRAHLKNIIDIILILFKVTVDSIVEIYVNLSVPCDVKVLMVESWS